MNKFVVALVLLTGCSPDGCEAKPECGPVFQALRRTDATYCYEPKTSAKGRDYDSLCSCPRYPNAYSPVSSAK